VPPDLAADDRARTERALAAFVRRHARGATPRLVMARAWPRRSSASPNRPRS
jgi:hypothetical protein